MYSILVFFWLVYARNKGLSTGDQGGGHVCFNSGKRKVESIATSQLSFPLYSGRVCKRLIKLRHGESLSLYFSMSGDEFELQYFSLSRVTQSFARSRILMKLQALHPRYKTRKRLCINRPDQSDCAKLVNLNLLW